MDFIDSIRLYRYCLPLVTPIAWQDKFHSYREGLLLCLKRSEKEGWGEIAPLPGFSRESLMDAEIQGVWLVRLLRNREIDLFKSSILLAHPSVQFGFESAWYDLGPEDRSKSKSKLLPVACCKLLDSKDYKQNKPINFKDNHGSKAVKIKVGKQSLGHDLAFIHEVYENNPGLEIRIDANRRWSLKTAKEFLYSTRSLSLGYIEEPLRDKTELKTFTSSSHIPLALDETLREPDAALYKQLADIYVLKPTLSGGITKTATEIQQAETDHTRCIISSSYESGIGMLKLLELARTIPDEIHGLDTYQVFERDVFKKQLPLHSPILQPDMPSIKERDIDIAFLKQVVEL
ncbi:MAG: o-succinylbenzoate synthase [Bacteroidetes bacterium]|nr:o-succinylbenzoate synthase [Bacteroidota bacterium]MCY4204137.1 o-succinylbenzoate synthase [Bacteroidota bacterium]